MATGLGVSRGPRQTSFHLMFKAFWVQGPVRALCTRRVRGGLPGLACVHEGEGGVSLESTPSCPTRGSRGCSQRGLRVWVQSEYCPAPDLRCKGVRLRAARAVVRLCVFFGRRRIDCGWRPTPTEGCKVAGGLSDPHTRTSHLARIFARRGPSAGAGQTLVHSPRGGPGHLTRSPLLAGSPRTLWGMAGC